MTPKNRRPNVLILLCDQLRRQSVAHFGGPVPTPNIDRLAAEGCTISRAYCTYPMCTPARAAMLAGRFPHALRSREGRPYLYNGFGLAEETTTFAHTLTTAGYQCAYIGKWHCDQDPGGTPVPAGPRRFGFDHYWAGINGGSPRTAPFHFDESGRRIEAGECWEADLQTDLALAHLSRLQATSEPWCCLVSWLPPHDPYDLPPSRQGLFADAARHVVAVDANVPDRLRDTALAESRAYHANVLGIDDLVGRVLDHLEHLGEADNTLVLFTSDHGCNLFNHGLHGKNQFYEEAIAIPSIWRLPGQIPAGQCNDAFCNLTDVAPTILSLCGVSIPETMQGDSLAAVLTGVATEGPNNSTYLEVDHPWYDYRYGQGPGGNRRCLVTRDWKLVLLESRLGLGGAIPWQLFDLHTDPLEQTNLADDPGYLPVISELAPHLVWWMERTNDSFIEHVFSGLRELYGQLPKSLPAPPHGDGVSTSVHP